ncbi:hypothetical protein [Crossiella sp. NPDC003009]
MRALEQARAGDAAALALAVECLVAAEVHGVRAELYEALSDVDRTGLANFLDLFVATHLRHCGRRLHELRRAETRLDALGVPPPR